MSKQKTKQTKRRVRIWSGDVWRYIATGECTSIVGIHSYDANLDRLCVTFDGGLSISFDIHTYHLLRQNLAKINRYLKGGNIECLAS